MKLYVQKSNKGDWYVWYVLSTHRMVDERKCYCYVHGTARDEKTAWDRAEKAMKKICY